MVEKLTGHTKLSMANRPVTKKDKRVSKVEKLGLITQGKRRMTSFRFKHETIELLDSLIQQGRATFHDKISGADIIEIALSVLNNMNKKEFEEKGTNYLRKKH